MSLLNNEGAVMQKVQELCETLVAAPEFASIRQRMDAFVANEAARGAYEEVQTLGQSLREKQHSGATLSDAEIADFEAKRESFLNNPVARGFLDAQEEMQEARDYVSRHVMKTFELGRLPQPEDFHSCGHGCNCH